MKNILTHLGEVPVETFVEDYWQKKPLLIRNAFSDFISPISPDELAGLALEEEIESRLIIENNGKDSLGKGPWELRCGPFSEIDFQNLPDNHWTLLVQAVDQWVPEIADLMRQFYFLPRWRLDDIMISYAPNGGSVGPHYDQYDVFLIQSQGQREWKIGQYCSDNEGHLENTPLHVLKEFNAEDSWLLSPGDMLYLPPQLAHWGIAKSDCMTISVGFRAPSHGELAAAFSDNVFLQCGESDRYQDLLSAVQQHNGEITQQSLDNVRTILSRYLNDDVALAGWFGELMSSPKYASDDSEFESDSTVNEVRDLLSGGEIFAIADDARLAFYKETERQTLLFANGKQYSASLTLADYLCSTLQFDQDSLLFGMKQDSIELRDLTTLAELLSAGVLYILED